MNAKQAAQITRNHQQFNKFRRETRARSMTAHTEGRQWNEGWAIVTTIGLQTIVRAEFATQEAMIAALASNQF